MLNANLAIDCSSELCSVALCVDGRVSFKEKLAPREHAYLVLPFAEALLNENNLNFSDLNHFVFARGPGAFTGLRVAASVAQGLAIAYNKPLRACSSLHLLAMQMDARTQIPIGSNVLAVLDARMSELYWAVFKKSEAGLKPSSLERLDSPKKLLENFSESAYFVGPGCRHLQQVLNEGVCLNFEKLAEFTEVFPHAKDMFELMDIDDTTKNSQGLPFPVYLRNHVADKSA